MKSEVEWFKYKEKKPEKDCLCLVIKNRTGRDIEYYKKNTGSEYDYFSHHVYMWAYYPYPKNEE